MCCWWSSRSPPTLRSWCLLGSSDCVGPLIVSQATGAEALEPHAARLSQKLKARLLDGAAAPGMSLVSRHRRRCHCLQGRLPRRSFATCMGSSWPVLRLPFLIFFLWQVRSSDEFLLLEAPKELASRSTKHSYKPTAPKYRREVWTSGTVCACLRTSLLRMWISSSETTNPAQGLSFRPVLPGFTWFYLVLASSSLRFARSFAEIPVLGSAGASARRIAGAHRRRLLAGGPGPKGPTESTRHGAFGWQISVLVQFVSALASPSMVFHSFQSCVSLRGANCEACREFDSAYRQAAVHALLMQLFEVAKEVQHRRAQAGRRPSMRWPWHRVI